MLKEQFHFPRRGHKTFEITLYNRDVRDLLKQGGHHHRFADRWADAQRHVVEAMDAGEARERAALQYAPELGFVITGVAMLPAPILRRAPISSRGVVVTRQFRSNGRIIALAETAGPWHVPRRSFAR